MNSDSDGDRHDFQQSCNILELTVLHVKDGKSLQQCVAFCNPLLAISSAMQQDTSWVQV